MTRTGRPKTSQEGLVLQTIIDWNLEHGCPPTVRELADHLGYSGPSGVYRYLSQLKVAGRIRWVPNVARTIEIIDDRAHEGAPVV